MVPKELPRVKVRMAVRQLFFNSLSSFVLIVSKAAHVPHLLLLSLDALTNVSVRFVLEPSGYVITVHFTFLGLILNLLVIEQALFLLVEISILSHVFHLERNISHLLQPLLPILNFFLKLVQLLFEVTFLVMLYLLPREQLVLLSVHEALHAVQKLVWLVVRDGVGAHAVEYAIVVPADLVVFGHTTK